MKNKSKLQKIRSGAAGRNLPQGWFLMSRRQISVADLKLIAVEMCDDVEIWPELGVLEIVLAEKGSIDIETLALDLRDDYSNNYLKEHEVRSLFYVNFPEEEYEKARGVLKKMAEAMDGFVCGDTEDFSPIL